MDHWYFAYGSNLLRSQMVARSGAIRTGNEQPRLVRLPNFRVAFNMRGEEGQHFANLVAAGEDAWGVVYRMSAAALVKLDAYEQGYERRSVIVVDEHDAGLGAVAYFARLEHLAPVGLPSADYLQKILTGAREHGLPAQYIESLVSRTV